MNIKELFNKYNIQDGETKYYSVGRGGQKRRILSGLITEEDFPKAVGEIISLPVEAQVSNAKSGLYPEQIELRLLEKIADDIAIRDYPSLSKTSKNTLLKYFGKLIKEKTDSFLSR